MDDTYVLVNRKDGSYVKHIIGEHSVPVFYIGSMLPVVDDNYFWKPYINITGYNAKSFWYFINVITPETIPTLEVEDETPIKIGDIVYPQEYNLSLRITDTLYGKSGMFFIFRDDASRICVEVSYDKDALFSYRGTTFENLIEAITWVLGTSANNLKKQYTDYLRILKSIGA